MSVKEAANGGVLEKLFLKFSEYPLENICDEVSFLIKL